MKFKKRVKTFFQFVCIRIHRGSPMFCGWMQGFFILRVVCFYLPGHSVCPPGDQSSPTPLLCVSWTRHARAHPGTCNRSQVRVQLYYYMYGMPTVHLMLKLLDINNAILYISYLLQLTELATGTSSQCKWKFIKI